MGIGDLAGIGQLKDALAITNKHLEAVIGELKETNGQRLELIATELQRNNALLERLLETNASEGFVRHG